MYLAIYFTLRNMEILHLATLRWNIWQGTWKFPCMLQRNIWQLHGNSPCTFSAVLRKSIRKFPCISVSVLPKKNMGITVHLRCIKELWRDLLSKYDSEVPFLILSSLRQCVCSWLANVSKIEQLMTVNLATKTQCIYSVDKLKKWKFLSTFNSVILDFFAKFGERDQTRQIFRKHMISYKIYFEIHKTISRS